MQNRALFLDRDGIINVDDGYVHRKDAFFFNAEIFSLCRLALNYKFLILVCTNQSGIGRGFYSEQQFLELTDWMLSEFEAEQIKITKVYYCPHHPSQAVTKYRKDCYFRKPNPGQVLRAIDEFNLDPRKSILIGDQISDMNAGAAANIGSNILVSESFQVSNKVPFEICRSLSEATNIVSDILKRLELP